MQHHLRAKRAGTTDRVQAQVLTGEHIRAFVAEIRNAGFDEVAAAFEHENLQRLSKDRMREIFDTVNTDGVRTLAWRTTRDSFTHHASQQLHDPYERPGTVEHGTRRAWRAVVDVTTESHPSHRRD